MELYHKNIRYRLENLAVGFVLFLFAVLCVYPVLYVLFASFSNPMKLAQHTGLLWKPLEFTLEGYKVAASYQGIWKGYGNTILIVVSGVTVNMCLTVLAAYVLSKKELYLHRAMNLFVIFTMYFSGGLIPTYMVVKGLHLVNSMLALILPVAINTWNLIILRTSMEEMPKSLTEAAKIDGAGDWTILLNVVIPLIKPTLAVLVLYYVVQHWNSWFNAMIYLQSREKYPLQLFLREILVSGTSNSAASQGFDMTELDQYKQLVKYCTTILATAPILCIYPFLQKYFVKGVLIGSVKE
nr:carbohydrate ABC transporter permease [uncultured Acetatifactor sp.]